MNHDRRVIIFTLLGVLIFLLKLVDTITLWHRSSQDLVEARKYGGEWFETIYFLLLGVSIYLSITLFIKPGKRWIKITGILFSIFTIILYAIDFSLGISIILRWW